jgi:hypothetical protein
MRKLMVALALLVFGSVAWAADKNGIYAKRTESCGPYMKDRKSQNAAKVLNHAVWIFGYVTAYNRQTPDTVDIRGGTEIDGILLWLDNWCKENPSKDMSDAMEAFTNEMHPRRDRKLRYQGR